MPFNSEIEIRIWTIIFSALRAKYKQFDSFCPVFTSERFKAGNQAGRKRVQSSSGGHFTEYASETRLGNLRVNSRKLSESIAALSLLKLATSISSTSALPHGERIGRARHRRAIRTPSESNRSSQPNRWCLFWLGLALSNSGRTENTLGIGSFVLYWHRSTST
jgi:hypothetical protein